MRKAREAAGLSQQELADAIGISRRSVSAYETSGTDKRPVLLSWSLQCSVPLPWLMTGEEEEPSGDGIAAEWARRKGDRRRGPRRVVQPITAEECAAGDSNPEPAGLELAA